MRYQPKIQELMRQNKQASERRQQLKAALALIIVGVGLLIGGFMVPPLGHISPSVLVAFGEILTFIGSLFGIDYHYKFRS